MAKQIINIGTTANDRTGDPLRIAFRKANENFTEVYTAIDNIDVDIPDIPSDISDLTDTENRLVIKSHVELVDRLESDPDTIVVFVKGPNTYSNTVFDAIDTDMSLTREASGIGGQGAGIYNKELEVAWQPTISPLGTEWNLDGWDNLDDVKVRFYEPLREVFRNRIGEYIVGAKLVMHDTINDKYYKFEFSQWQQGADHNGSFAYTRELIDTTNSVGVTFPDGTTQVTKPKEFTGYKEIFIGDTSQYDIQPKDAGKYINAFNTTIYIPNEGTFAFPRGSLIHFVASSGPVTLAPRGNAVIYGADGNQTSSWVIPEGTTASILKTNTNTWFISAVSTSLASTSLPYLELTNDPFIFEPYSGELVSFSKDNYETGNSAIDFIDEQIAITRGVNQGIYNPILEPQWDDNNNDGPSPEGTVWNVEGWDDLTNLNQRIYYSFYDAYGGNLGNLVLSSEPVMKDVANDKYYKFDFSVWGNSNNGAPVTYTRTQIDSVTGATIGEPVTFAKAGYDIPSQVNDPIDDGVTLARGNNQGLFNIDLETGWTTDGEDSPEGTLWNNEGWGKLRNVTQRTYGTFQEALDYNIGQNVIGKELVMWDAINNKYYAFKFSGWTQGQNNGGPGGGGFAYTRRLINTNQLFVKTDYGDEVDAISEGLHITRGEQGWLYNPLEDEGHDDNTPTGSLWNNDGWDDLTNVETRNYVPLETIWGGNFNSIPGAKMIMLDETTDKYWAVQFLSWTQGQNGGGFSYIRYELDLTQLQQGIKFADGSILNSANDVNRVKSTASGDRRIEEAVGNKTVSVTSRTVEQQFSGVTLSPTLGPAWDVFIDGTVHADLYSYVSTNNPDRMTLLINGSEYEVDPYISGSNVILYQINSQAVSYSQGDSFIVIKYTGAEPIVWWDKNDLPSGGSDFRGAVIDYHAYTGEATIIGTIHIVDDDGEENITHTEVSSGDTDSENDDLWFVQNEGTISYRRMDGESKTLKIHWTAKVFYGSEYNDD